MIGPSLFFGIRQLSSKAAERSYKRIRGAVAGIALAIVPMVVVIQVSGGLIRGISERYIEVGSFHLQARSFGYVDSEELAGRVALARGVAGVKSANEIRYGLGLLQSEDGRTGVAVQALPASLAEEDAAFRRYLEFLEGRFDLEDENALLVSEPIARELGVRTGDVMRLLTAKSTTSGRYILRQSVMRVTGIFTTGYHDLDKATVLIPLARGERLFTEDGSGILAIKVDDPFGNLENTRRELQSVLGSDWYVFTWYQLEEAMYTTFETTKNLLLLIMGLIIVVAGVNISGSLIMLVMEKEHDIAILRSTGVKAREVSEGFLFLGLTAGVVGTFLGMLLGILAAVHVNSLVRAIEQIISWMRYAALLIVSTGGAVEYKPLEILGSSFYLEEIPVVLRIRELLYTAILSISIAFLSSVIPARRAAKLHPVEILRRH